MLNARHIVHVYEQLRREAERIGRRLGRLDRVLCRLEALLPDGYVYREWRDDDRRRENDGSSCGNTVSTTS